MKAAFSRGEAVFCFGLAVLLDGLMGIRSLPALLSDGLLNPDSYMRLVRLQDSLVAGTPMHAVLRDGSGEGTVLHWSHLLDAMLLVLAAPFWPLLGMHASLHLAALLIGPISLGLLAVACAWLMAPLADKTWRWTAAALAALAPATAAYGLPGVTHHHVLLAAAVVMLAGLAARIAGGTRRGAAFGVVAGLGIWLSPETMPFLLLAFSGMGLAWILQPEQRAIGVEIAMAGVVFLAVILVAMLLDPPLPGIGAIELDRLSFVYVTLAFIIAVIGAALMGLDRIRAQPVTRAVLGALCGLAGFGIWLALYPSVLRGTDGLLDDAAARAFFDGIQEMKPVGSVAQGVAFLFDGAVAVLVLGWLAVRTRENWRFSGLFLYAAVCALILVVLGAQHVRFASYPTAAGAAVLPVILTEVTRRLTGTALSFARMGVLAVMMLVTRADIVAVAAGDHKTASLAATPTCAVDGLAPMLAPYAGQIVLTHMNDVPELLYRTQIRTVGSLYHRNVPGFMRLRDAWSSPPSQNVPAAVLATRATLVLGCRGNSTGENVLYDQLARGEVPPWLKQVADDPASGNTLYQVIPMMPQR